MKPEVKRKWIEALRSGDYKQGINSLRIDRDNKVTYCCLGVLCDLYAQENRKRWKSGADIFYPTLMKEASVLPTKVMEWAGIVGHTGEFTYKNGHHEDLASLNDRGKSFKQIARVIEKYF